MTDLLSTSKYLTFSFEQYLGALSLQYHPDSISVNESARHNTQPTTQGAVTYIAPMGSQQRTMNVTTYCSWLVTKDDTDTANALMTMGLVGVAVGTLSLGGDKVLQVISALKNTISMAKGVYSSISGIISPKLPLGNAGLRGSNEQIANILSTLTYAEQQGVPCTIMYDIDNWTFNGLLPRYVINSLNVSVNRIFEGDGSIMEFTIQIGLIGVGQTVIDISRGFEV
jgi:hypothetical protein